MNNFNDIKNIWKRQEANAYIDVPEDLYKKIQKADTVVNNKHTSTIIILLVTMGLVTTGYLLIFKQQNWISIAGIVTMNLSLLIRIVIEVISLRRMRQLDFLSPPAAFANALASFYAWRRKIHQYPTWLTVGAYTVGVGLLFNEFHKHLPAFWFRFFLVQLVIIAIILFFFIRKQIRKELSSLKQLIATYQEIGQQA